MTTLTWPAGFEPQRASWHLEANTSSFVSPLTRFAQTTEIPGARWVCDLTLPPTRTVASQRTWEVFLSKMRGMAGRVYVGPFHYSGEFATTWAAGTGTTADDTSPKADSTTPTADSGYISSLGTPVVQGAAQSGATLYTRGWTPGATIAEAGAYFSYDTSAGRTMHLVTADAQSDGSGYATLSIEPPIRTAPAHEAALEIVAPTCIMRLQDDRAGARNFGPGLEMGLSFGLIEVF